MTESAPTSSPAQGEPPDLSTLDGVLAEANNLIRMHDAADSGGGCFDPKASRKWDRRVYLHGGMVLKHLVAEVARLQSRRSTPDTGERQNANALDAAKRIVAADDQHNSAPRLKKAWAWDIYTEEAIVCAAVVARALLKEVK